VSLRLLGGKLGVGIPSLLWRFCSGLCRLRGDRVPILGLLGGISMSLFVESRVETYQCILGLVERKHRADSGHQSQGLVKIRVELTRDITTNTSVLANVPAILRRYHSRRLTIPSAKTYKGIMTLTHRSP
jgi:hypothetical protein